MGDQNSLSRAIIIDDDELVVNQARAFLERQGIAEIDQAKDGSSAWELLQKYSYDLIVLDWKLPKVGGLTLFNRIRRNSKMAMTPVLVISGFLRKNDFRLLAEFPMTKLLEKPFTANKLKREFTSLVKEQAWYYENDQDIQFLLQEESEPKEILQRLQGIFKKSPNPVPIALLAAKRLISRGFDKLAEELYGQILVADPDCVWAMNELGKLHHRNGKTDQAMRVLREARQLSPQNMARLCLLGELELNSKNTEVARELFENALEIDPEDKIAESGLTIAENMSEIITSYGKDQVAKSLASMLNIIGIALVREGKYEKGIAQYKSAMPFLRVKEDAAKLAFNLGLGYLRWGKPRSALPWFEKSAAESRGIGVKSAKYVQKISARTGFVPMDSDEVADIEWAQATHHGANDATSFVAERPLERVVAPQQDLAAFGPIDQFGSHDDDGFGGEDIEALAERICRERERQSAPLLPNSVPKSGNAVEAMEVDLSYDDEDDLDILKMVAAHADEGEDDLVSF